MSKGKKDITKLIPVKKRVYNPKIFKDVEITYYVKPKTKNNRNKKDKSYTDKINSNEILDLKNDLISEKALKQFFCNL